jgi:hypothetical protein
MSRGSPGVMRAGFNTKARRARRFWGGNGAQGVHHEAHRGHEGF